MNRFLLSMRTVRRPLSSAAPHSSPLSNGSSVGESKSWRMIPILSAVTVIALQCYIIAQQSSVVDNVKRLMTDRKEQQRLELLLLLKIMSFKTGRSDPQEAAKDNDDDTRRSSQSRSGGSAPLSAI